MKNNIVEITSAKSFTRKPRAKKQTDEQRFKEHLDAPDANGCTNWNATCFTNGYGKFCADGTSHYSHRYAWMLKHGPIPAGSMVLHSCDNRRCCNVKHLRLGDAKMNAADREERGRGIKGRSVPRRKFTSAEITRIVDLAASGTTQYRISNLMARTEPVIAGVLKRNAEAIAKKKSALALKAAVVTILQPLNASMKAAIADLKKIAA